MHSSDPPPEHLSVVRAKLRPPTLTSCLPRERLFRQLDAALTRPIVMICADSGYGKSMLMASYLADRGRRTVWYNLDHLDAASPVFVQHLLHGLAEVGPSSGADRAPGRTPAELALALRSAISALEDLDEDLVIVLDDFHRLTAGDDVPGLVELVISALPQQVHLVLLSRRSPDLPVARYRLSGRLAEVGRADLAFTPEEAAALFTQIYRSDLSVGETELIHQHTRGWAAGLCFAHEAVRGLTGECRERFWEHLAETPAIVDYLATELLAHQPSNVQDFLLRTSVLHEIEPMLADRLLGATGSLAVLRRLAAENLFTTRTDDPDPCFRYHPILRKYLYARLAETHGRPTVAALHHRAAGLYHAAGASAFAVAHYLAAHDYKAAAQVFTHIPLHILQETYRPMVEGLLQHISPERNVAYLSVSFRRCVPLPVLESLADQIESERALAGLTPVARGSMLLHVAFVRNAQGQFDRALAALGKAQVLYERRGDWPTLGLVLSLCAINHLQGGNLESAHTLSMAAIKLASERGLDYVRMHAQWVLGMVTANLGEPAAALELVEGALAIPDLPERAVRGLLLCWAGALRAELADEARAESYLAEAMALAEEHQIPLDTGYACIFSGRFELRRRRTERAVALLERAEALLQGYTSYLTLARIHLAAAALAHGQPERAAAALKAALACSRDPNFHYMLTRELHAVPSLVAFARKLGLTLPPPDSERRPDRPPKTVGMPQPSAGVPEPVPVAVHEPAQLAIRTFGCFEMHRAGIPIGLDAWTRQSALRLFLFLLSRKDRAAPVEVITDVLWPDVDADVAMRRFQVAKNALGKVFDPGSRPGQPRSVVRAGNRYRLQLGSAAWVDADRYAECVAAAQQARADAQAFSALLEANKLYRGDFLADYPSEEFLVSERARFRQAQVGVLLGLAALYQKNGETTQECWCLESALQLEPEREDLHRRVMEYHLNRGDRAAAAAAYRRCESNFRRELGIAPSANLQALYRTAVSGS